MWLLQKLLSNSSPIWFTLGTTRKRRLTPTNSTKRCVLMFTNFAHNLTISCHKPWWSLTLKPKSWFFIGLWPPFIICAFRIPSRHPKLNSPRDLLKLVSWHCLRRTKYIQVGGKTPLQKVFRASMFYMHMFCLGVSGKKKKCWRHFLISMLTFKSTSWSEHVLGSVQVLYKQGFQNSWPHPPP